jgi:hypothetical protein
MKIKLPGDLKALSRGELEKLLADAEAEFDALSADVAGEGSTVTQETLDAMRELNAASTALTEQIATVASEEAARMSEAQELAAARAARAATPEPTPEPVEPDPDTGGGENAGTGGAGAPETPATGGAEVVTEAENIAANAATPEPAVTASSSTPSFRGLGARTGRAPAAQAPAQREIGFRMRPNAHRFQDGAVGFRELAASIDGMATGHRIHSNRDPLRIDGAANKIPLSLATLDRGFGPSHIVDPNLSEEQRAARIDEIVRGTEYRAATFNDNGALVASGGHCAVPETIYEFCEVTPATGLATWPAMNLGPRGGQRRPMEPDFSELYATLPWRFTEAELEANNPDGTPVVTKPCIEIPCVEWEEIYVEAIGLCVTSGILQRRGFPESIERFLAEVVKAHLIKVSVWSLMDVEADSTPYTISAGALGAAGAYLNGLALRAVVQRQKMRLPKDAPIDGKAPAWMLDVARADMALQQGRDVKGITDAEIDGWLASRNIFIEWVQHWQALPEASVRWPSQVKTVLYPRGTWYQHLEHVIEVGTLHSKEMLQKNRQMELFTEDEYLMDRRCNVSEVITVNLCANGSVGAREQITCPATTNEVQALTITGSPTGGHFTASFQGSAPTDPIAHNATAATVQAELAKLPTIGIGNVAVTGPAGGPYHVTFQGALGATNVAQLSVTHAFTGGTNATITPSTTTPGAPN